MILPLQGAIPLVWCSTQGAALGCVVLALQADFMPCKGSTFRTRFMILPLQGACSSHYSLPRAQPWALDAAPFGASCARSWERVALQAAFAASTVSFPSFFCRADAIKSRYARYYK